jgi:hypothetical protein
VAACGGLGGAGIDDDDLGFALIHHHPLPHDGVGDAGIGADEDEGVALLEVSVGEGRGVEAKALFVGDVRGGHALAGVGVAVERAHAEFEERSQERHFLHDDLAGAEERDRVRAVLALDALKRSTKDAPLRPSRWVSSGSPRAARGGAERVARS